MNREDLPALAALVSKIRPDVWRLYQYSSRGDQNAGQQRHRLSDQDFRILAKEAAHLAAPVWTVPSTEAETAGCLIVDPAGNVLQPTGIDYVRHGNCLEEPLDRIWARIPGPSRETVADNKRWLSILD